MTDVPTAGEGILAPAIPSALAGYTFQNFAEGESNKDALMLARRYSEHFPPAPMGLINGLADVGKTHLLGTILNASAERWNYIDMQRTDEDSYRDRAFKALRSDEPLALDEAHLLLRPGTEVLQEAFRVRLKRRLVTVCAADLSAPVDTQAAQMYIHLRSGWSTHVEPAGYELRMAIIRARYPQIAAGTSAPPELPEAIVAYLAKSFGSPRPLLGALTSLVFSKQSSLATMTLEEVVELLRTHVAAFQGRLTVDTIQKAVANFYSLKQSDLTSERRARVVARPRQVAMWLCKQLTTRSLPDIGRRFGNRDHTTVLHAVRRIEKLRDEDPKMQKDLDILMRHFAH